MKIEKHTKRLPNKTPKYGYYPLHDKPTDHTVEFVKVIGTLDEIMAYSHENAVAVARCEAVEHLFPKWDEDSRYVVLHRGEVICFADRSNDISDYGWYVHEGVVE